MDRLFALLLQRTGATGEKRRLITLLYNAAMVQNGRVSIVEWARRQGTSRGVVQKQCARAGLPPPSDVLRFFRILRTLERMERDGLTVHAASTATGWRDPCIFSNVTARELGVRPTQITCLEDVVHRWALQCSPGRSFSKRRPRPGRAWNSTLPPRKRPMPRRNHSRLRRLGTRQSRQFGPAGFQKWIRAQLCEVCGAAPPSEPSHIKTRGAGGGPEHIIPMCHSCHGHYHVIGHKSFEADMGRPFPALLTAVRDRWANECRIIPAAEYMQAIGATEEERVLVGRCARPVLAYEHWLDSERGVYDKFPGKSADDVLTEAGYSIGPRWSQLLGAALRLADEQRAAAQKRSARAA